MTDQYITCENKHMIPDETPATIDIEGPEITCAYPDESARVGIVQ
jgi:hypothetical protein